MVPELKAAQKAIEGARSAGTDKYAAQEFDAAQKALAVATAEITKQDNSFILTRDYAAAKKLLNDVSKKSQVAQSAGLANKEKTRSEVEVLIPDTTASLESAKSAVERVAKGKDTKPDFAGLKADLDMLTAQIDEARAQTNRGEYLEAKASLNQIKQRASGIASELEQSAQKVKSKKAS